MQNPESTQPPAEANFAGLLASLAGPGKSEEAPWSDDALEDDIATLSYEQALRTHGQHRPPDEETAPSPQQALAASATETAPAARPLKNSSITIRLSTRECGEIRRRAAEAGLTVSAYLRSCALEVDSLRAQVKETLAELRNATASAATEASAAIASDARRNPGLWRRLWSPVRHSGAKRSSDPARLNPANPLAPI